MLKKLFQKCPCSKTPKHARMILKAYPEDEESNTPTNLSGLGLYGNKNPEKLSDIGHFLSLQIQRDFEQGSIRRVLVGLKIFDFLVTSCTGELRLFVDTIIKTLKILKGFDEKQAISPLNAFTKQHLDLKIKIFETISITIHSSIIEQMSTFCVDIISIINFSHNEKDEYNYKIRALGMLMILKTFKRIPHFLSHLQSLMNNLLKNFTMALHSSKVSEKIHSFEKIVETNITRSRLVDMARDCLKLICNETNNKTIIEVIKTIFKFLDTSSFWSVESYYEGLFFVILNSKFGRCLIPRILRYIMITKGHSSPGQQKMGILIKVKATNIVLKLLDFLYEKKDRELSIHDEKEVVQTIINSYFSHIKKILNPSQDESSKNKSEKKDGKGRKKKSQRRYSGILTEQTVKESKQQKVKSEMVIREAKKLEENCLKILLIISKGRNFNNVKYMEMILSKREKDIENDQNYLRSFLIFCDKRKVKRWKEIYQKFPENLFQKILKFSVNPKISADGRVSFLRIIRRIGKELFIEHDKEEKKKKNLKKKIVTSDSPSSPSTSIGGSSTITIRSRSVKLAIGNKNIIIGPNDSAPTSLTGGIAQLAFGKVSQFSLVSTVILNESHYNDIGGCVYSGLKLLNNKKDNYIHIFELLFLYSINNNAWKYHIKYMFFLHNENIVKYNVLKEKKILQKFDQFFFYMCNVTVYSYLYVLSLILKSKKFFEYVDGVVMKEQMEINKKSKNNLPGNVRGDIKKFLNVQDSKKKEYLKKIFEKKMRDFEDYCHENYKKNEGDVVEKNGKDDGRKKKKKKNMAEKKKLKLVRSYEKGKIISLLSDVSSEIKSVLEKPFVINKKFSKNFNSRNIKISDDVTKKTLFDVEKAPTSKEAHENSSKDIENILERMFLEEKRLKKSKSSKNVTTIKLNGIKDNDKKGLSKENISSVESLDSIAQSEKKETQGDNDFARYVKKIKENSYEMVKFVKKMEIREEELLENLPKIEEDCEFEIDDYFTAPELKNLEQYSTFKIIPEKGFYPV